MTKKKHTDQVDLDTGEILVDEIITPSTDTAAVLAPIKLTRFTSLYRHDRTRSERFATVNTDDSLTQQSDAADTDINVIMKRYGPTGQLPNVQQQPIYGDFTGDLSYRAMCDRILAANEAFMEVPAEIRKRFENDPQQWIEFVTNKENLPELRKMGLADPEPPAPKAPEPMLVKVVPDTPPK